MNHLNHGIDTNQEHQFALCHVRKNTRKKHNLGMYLGNLPTQNYVSYEGKQTIRYLHYE